METHFGNRLVLKQHDAAAEIAVDEGGAEYFFGAGRAFAEMGGKVCRCRTVGLGAQKGEMRQAVEIIKAADPGWL